MDDGTFPVILTFNAPYASLGAANYVGQELADRPALFLICLAWSMRKPRAVRRLLPAIVAYRDKHPKHRVLLLCNEMEEQAAFSVGGAKAIHCSANAFVDEEIFRPIPTSERIYEAVYNAAMVPWKRHRLASLIPNCIHMFYEKAELGRERTMAYLAELQVLMPHHHFLNPIVNERIELLERPAVNATLAQCRSGLCLSAVEGAMFASMEYLMAGLPVVSTPALGGRHVFADPEFWLTVADNNEAVRDGVIELTARNVPPERIRALTLKRVYAHRARLRDAVALVTDGRVKLPAQLDDPVYRRAPGIPWPDASDLAGALGL